MKEQRKFWHNQQLGVSLMQAVHIDYAYPRHSHDHYVICLIEQGVQSFMHGGTKYITPPSGLILINPGVVHTGESATEYGFRMRSLYPTVSSMKSIVYELTGRHQEVPYFRDVRVNDHVMTKVVCTLHQVLTNDFNVLARESCFIDSLVQLIKRYADTYSSEQRLGNERWAVQKVRHYIEAHYAEQISLSDLAEYVALSPYYLLRVFRAEVGLPPHAYLQDVRIRRVQHLLELGRPLADVAFSVGYSSQSHFTRRFKHIVGVTPGRYAAQIHS